MKNPTLRPSVALISAALFVSTSATANMSIGRTPSMFAGGGTAPIVKPNVFLIIDNGVKMAGSKGKDWSPIGNRLQNVAAALIASLPQLEGKVRLGYSTVFSGIASVGKLSGGEYSCSDLKLNGNLAKIDPAIRRQVSSNSKYYTGNNDFIFREYGSGFGNLVPRDFQGRNASYIYSWLGGMCVGELKNFLPPNLTLAPVFNGGKKSDGFPPYADLRDPVAYQAAAKKAHNPYSFPLANWYSINTKGTSYKPLVDIYSQVIGIVSDNDIICSVAGSRQDGKKRCGLVNIATAAKSSGGNTVLRDYPNDDVFKYFSFDAYAPTVPSKEIFDSAGRSKGIIQNFGFPDDKNPSTCRRNYVIMMSFGGYGKPNTVMNNADVGTDGYGLELDGKRWNLGYFNFPLNDETRIYRFFPNKDNKRKDILPIDLTRGSNNILGSGGRFSLAKLVLQTYFMDLRKGLGNNLTPYIDSVNRKYPHGRPQGIGNRPISTFWDRKNDPAPWQHITFFALGFTDDGSFASWTDAGKTYKKNYSDLDPRGGLLEPYFRAVEDGTIYEQNNPLPDWGRGGYGLVKAGINYYFYKDPTTHTVSKVEAAPPHFQRDVQLRAMGALSDMDYAKAGMIGRGGAYEITDYQSIQNVISMIAARIKDAMVQGITGGAISGGGRVTASQQAAGGNESVLFTTYLDQKNAAGNIFAFKNCPLIEQKIVDKSNGAIIDNPLWAQNNCGKRLWNAATVLYNDRHNLSKKTIVPLKTGTTLTGGNFAWDGLDNELKSKLQAGGDAALGKARVDWLNGKLVKEFTDPKISAQLRTRFTIAIPDEQQNYAVDDHGNIVRDQNGNIQKANLTSIPDLIGEIVYGTPKAVDNRGTLPAAHPLNDDKYREFVKNTVMNRQPLVLAGSNDGHLYAFNNASDRKGQEHNASFAFSFIPRHVITKDRDNLANFTQKLLDPKRQGLVNGPFTVRDVLINGQWRTYLVGTLGEGGGVVYALDISDGRANPQMFRWETDNKYGSIMADPRIVWLRKKCDTVGCTAEGKWVVLVPTGYNTQDRRDPLDVALVVLDLEDGHELGRIETTARYTNTEGEKDQNGNYICNLVKTLTASEKADPGAEEVHNNLEPEATITGDLDARISPCENGLGPLTVFDADSDSGADYVFAGDLMGHVWKFDLSNFFQTDTSKPQFSVAYHAPLFIAQSPSNCTCAPRQPITSMIEIDDGAYGEGSMLYFGTGRLFTQQERNDKQVQSFYGIWDIPRFSHQANIAGFKLPLRRQGNARYDFLHYSVVNVDQSAVASPDSSLAKFKELRTVKRDDNLSSEKFLTFDLQGQPVDNNAKAVGWIIDFPAGSAGERVLGRANSFEDAVFFPSFTPNAATHGDPCQPQDSAVGGDARFYMVDRLTGGELEKSPFDFSHDGTQNADDGINVTPDKVDNGGDIQRLGYNKITDSNGKINVSPAGVMVGRGNGDFLTVTGVLERAAQATKTYNCDYSRQVVFPSTVDPATGNPLVLSSCNRNRYRVWKQPAIE